MEKVRIALVQMQSRFGATKENIEKIAGFVREAAGRKAGLICFPELSIHGYDREKAHLAAETIPGDSSLAISSLAGDEFSVFSTGKARFGIQICWDLHFPEVTTVFSLKGAEIIFAPHASPSIVGDREGIWLKYLPARAYDNAVFVAACNLVGDGGNGQVFCGGAMVLDPKGNVIAGAFNGREELLVADLEPDLINTIRLRESDSMRNSFFLEGRRPKLYGELVEPDREARRSPSPLTLSPGGEGIDRARFLSPLLP